MNSAPRPGGTAAAAWNGNPKPTARRNGENVEQLQAWGYAAEWIDHKQVQELEPDIDLATIGDAPVAYFPDEGWLDPVVYAHAMLSAARRRHGAQVICGARVVDLAMTGDRVPGVRTADGTLHEADMVVNCAGRWTNEAVREAGLHLPLAPTVGFLVFTPPVAASLAPRGPHQRDRCAPGRRRPADAALEPDRCDAAASTASSARRCRRRATWCNAPAACCPRSAMSSRRRSASPSDRSRATRCPPSDRCRGPAATTSRSPTAR